MTQIRKTIALLPGDGIGPEVTGAAVQILGEKTDAGAVCATFSPDGKAALSGHLNGFVYVTPLK